MGCISAGNRDNHAGRVGGINHRRHAVVFSKCRTRQRIRRATTAHPPRHSDATDCRGLYLLARVFHLELERCGGTVKVVAALTEPGAIRKYLQGVGLPARAPPLARPVGSHNKSSTSTTPPRLPEAVTPDLKSTAGGKGLVCPRRTVGRCQPSHPAPDLHHRRHRPHPTGFSGPLR